MKTSSLFRSSSFLFLVVTLSLLTGYFVFAVWSGPPGTPPDPNTDPPLNVSTNPQVKMARLSASEFLDYTNAAFYLMNSDGETKLNGSLAIGGKIKDSNKVAPDDVIYDPVAQYTNCFNPALPDVPRTNTGVIGLDSLPTF
jgi:hypothetical protein